MQLISMEMNRRGSFTDVPLDGPTTSPARPEEQFDDEDPLQQQTRHNFFDWKQERRDDTYPEKEPTNLSAMAVSVSTIDRDVRKRKTLMYIMLASIGLVMVGTIVVLVSRPADGPDNTPSSVINVASTPASTIFNEEAACETTLLLMRHCEKHGPTVTDGDKNEHCSYRGRQRSQHLATLFDEDDNSRNARWPAPSHLFAYHADRGNHMNFRQWETLRPLSHKVNVDIEFKQKHELAPDFLQLLNETDSEGNMVMCGQLSVASWKHSEMPDTAFDLGCGENEGCPEEHDSLDYDSIWELTFVYQPPKLGSEWLMNEQDEVMDERSLSTTDVDNTANEEEDESGRRRRLRKKQNKRKLQAAESLPDGWYVYASVVRQDFDALAFSHAKGSI